MNDSSRRCIQDGQSSSIWAITQIQKTGLVSLSFLFKLLRPGWLFSYLSNCPLCRLSECKTFHTKWKRYCVFLGGLQILDNACIPSRYRWLLIYWKNVMRRCQCQQQGAFPGALWNFPSTWSRDRTGWWGRLAVCQAAPMAAPPPADPTWARNVGRRRCRPPQPDPPWSSAHQPTINQTQNSKPPIILIFLAPTRLYWIKFFFMWYLTSGLFMEGWNCKILEKLIRALMGLQPMSTAMASLQCEVRKLNYRL